MPKDRTRRSERRSLSWFVATWNAIWETREGVPSTVVARLPEVMSYPTSLLFAADGTFFVGTRGGIVRLTRSWPDAPRHAADFLWEAGGQKRDCRPNDEAAEWGMWLFRGGPEPMDADQLANRFPSLPPRLVYEPCKDAPPGAFPVVPAEFIPV